MTDNVALALVAMLGTSIANIATSLLAYFKANKAATTGSENKDAIQEIHVAVNNRLTQLLAAKDLQHVAQANAAHATGRLEQQQIDFDQIKAAGFNQMMDHFESIWSYLRNRAIAEMNARGFLAPDESLIPQVREWYKPLEVRLKRWYKMHKDLSDMQLFFACQKEFDGQLVEEICKPYGVFAGSCIEMAVMVAKEDESRPVAKE